MLYAALQRRNIPRFYRFFGRDDGKGGRRSALQRGNRSLAPALSGFSPASKWGFSGIAEPDDAQGAVPADVANPCRPWILRKSGWRVRFFVYDRRISIEVFHALSDGGGAIVFFVTLLAEYLRQLGAYHPVGPGICDLSEPPARNGEDALMPGMLARARLISALRPKPIPVMGTPEPYYTFHVTMGFVAGGCA